MWPMFEFNYKVYIVPVIDWENQKEISQKVKNLQIEDLLKEKLLCWTIVHF
jgi:hypothetical protein